jgi:hypothetical protein
MVKGNAYPVAASHRVATRWLAAWRYASAGHVVPSHTRAASAWRATHRGTRLPLRTSGSRALCAPAAPAAVQPGPAAGRVEGAEGNESSENPADETAAVDDAARAAGAAGEGAGAPASPPAGEGPTFLEGIFGDCLSYPNVIWAQEVVTALRDAGGLPWWLAIAATTVTARGVLFPLAVYQQVSILTGLLCSEFCIVNIPGH